MRPGLWDIREAGNMLTVKVYRANGVVTEKETITAGLVGWKIRVVFSPAWKRLTKWAYFRAGETEAEPVKITGDAAVAEVEVPWKVLTTAGEYLEVGIKGISGDGDTVIPTIYINLGAIREGSGTEDGELSPTPIEALWLELARVDTDLYVTLTLNAASALMPVPLYDSDIPSAAVAEACAAGDAVYCILPVEDGARVLSLVSAEEDVCMFSCVDGTSVYTAELKDNVAAAQIYTPLKSYYEDGNIVLSREDEAETIDTVTYEGKTLRDIFETNSIIQGGDFENGMPTIDGVAGELIKNPAIQNDVCDTGSAAMKVEANGGTHYIKLPVHTYIGGHIHYNAFRARVDEYTQGRMGVQGVWACYAPTETTLGAWVRCSSYRGASSELNDKSYNSFIGCMSDANGNLPVLTGYIDNSVVLDLTALFGAGNEPGKGQMDALYDLYIDLQKKTVADRKFVVPSVPATADYSWGECLLKFKNVMNLKAKSLGMKNSAFDSPSGLPAAGMGNNYSTAADVLKLGLAAFGNERLMEILAAYTYTCRTGGANVRAIMTASLYHGASIQTSMGNAGYCLFGGKGGSLPGETGEQGNAGILNSLCLCSVGGRQAVVAVIGQWFYQIDDVGNRVTDSTGSYVKMGTGKITAQALDVVYELLEGKKLEDITPGETLVEHTTREEYPASVAACVVPEGNAGAWANYGTQAMLDRPTSYSVLPDEVRPLASISKVLTALIVLEYISDLDERVAIVDEDYVGGSGQQLNTGETLSFRDLLYLMLLESNNTAATALGRAVGERLLRRGESINYFRPVYEMKPPAR